MVDNTEEQVLEADEYYWMHSRLSWLPGDPMLIQARKIEQSLTGVRLQQEIEVVAGRAAGLKLLVTRTNYFEKCSVEDAEKFILYGRSMTVIIIESKGSIRIEYK